MFKFKILILFCFLLFNQFAFPQNRNMVWCFGDSSGIDFKAPGGPAPISTILNTRGSCVSISDTSGNLLFYSAYDPTVGIFGTDPVKVYDKTHTQMLNGDSIKGGGWYKELITIPAPQSDSLYYLFNVGVTKDYGLYYSTINVSQNGGLGTVVQKNIQLQTFKCTDGLTAVKHGNGRDWWILFRRWDINNNEFYKYLVTPNGISNVMIQNEGSTTLNGFTNMNFSPDGTKMVMINLAGLMELYDFDRCTGILSNPVTIYPEPTSAPYGRFWGCEFSSDGSMLYVTSSETTTYLFQYDLLATNIILSKDTLWTLNFPTYAGGGIKRAPNNKIYISTWYYNGIFPYPYQDSIYNFYNMNLSVINHPDSLGAASDFQPFSFYLGGKRTYVGLPNNPDYDMPALAGSPCDTLVNINELPDVPAPASLYVYYASNWQSAFINADKLKGTHYRLIVYDLMGKEVYNEAGKLTSQYFTKNLNCNSFNSGMYVVKLETEKEKLVRKFLVDN